MPTRKKQMDPEPAPELDSPVAEASAESEPSIESEPQPGSGSSPGPDLPVLPEPDIGPEQQAAPEPLDAPGPDQPSEQPREDLLRLNDQERGFTRDASEDDKWNYLAGAFRKHLLLTGVVAGIEMPESRNPICVIDYEGIRILIPGDEMFAGDWPTVDNVTLKHQLRLHRILGATVDFSIAGLDLKNKAAVGSRRAALLELQQRYYESGRVKEGILVACRVIGIAHNRITVEALGVDSEILGNEASWEWFSDISDLYGTGDIVVARVLAVEQDPETELYRVSLSIKAANDNPERKAIEKLKVGSNYFGTVTGVGDKLVFVRLQAGVNVKTVMHAMKEPPHKNDTVSLKVTRINPDTGTVYGIVTRVIKKNRLR